MPNAKISGSVLCLAFLSVLPLHSFAGEGGEEERAKRPAHLPPLEEAISAIRADYASQHYSAQCKVVELAHKMFGWRDGEFKIDFRGEHENSFVYGLIHIEGAIRMEQAIIGGRDILTVFVDKETNEIVRVAMAQ